MSVLFEILKVVFFFFTMLVGLFFVRWDIIIAAEYYQITKQFLMPAYLVFCGIMFGYILFRVTLWYDEENPNKHKIQIRSYIIGISVGVILAVLYILV